MQSGRANVRYGMIRPGYVLYSPMSVQSLNSGAAIAIGGKVEIERITAKSRNFIGKRSRARAYAANDPTSKARKVVIPVTMVLLRSADVKSEFSKIDW